MGVGYCLCVCVISWQYRETCRATSGPVLARTGPDWISPHESLATVNTAHDMGCARSGSFARFYHWSSLPYVVATRTRIVSMIWSWSSLIILLGEVLRECHDNATIYIFSISQGTGPVRCEVSDRALSSMNISY